MRMHYLQHVPFEGIGSIAEWAGRHGHEVQCTRLFAGDVLPALAAFDWLIVMGGPMSVHDAGVHSWLKREKAFIRRAIDAGRPVLGICLGAQLIADVLGASVSRIPVREVGWFPIAKTAAGGGCRLIADWPGTLDAFHWHGETFGMPEDAVPLLRSEACEHQAFVWGDRVVALQFHLELAPDDVDRLIAHCPADLAPGRYVQSAESMLCDEGRFRRARKRMTALLGALERVTGIGPGRPAA